MKSKHPVLTVSARKGAGNLLDGIPPWIPLAIKHFEKSPPAGERAGSMVMIDMPIDLLRTTGVPASLTDQLVGITLFFRKKEG